MKTQSTRTLVVATMKAETESVASLLLSGLCVAGLSYMFFAALALI